MMKIFTFSSILCFFFPLLMGILLFMRRKENKIASLWGLLCVSASIWGLGSYGFAVAVSKEEAFFWWQIAYIGIIAAPVLYYHFVCLFLKLGRRINKILLRLSYSLAGIILALNFFGQKIFPRGLKYVFNQFYWQDLTTFKSIPYIFFYVTFYWLLLSYSFLFLIKAYRNSSGLYRNQIKYLILGSIVGWLGPHGAYLVAFGINIYPFSNFFIALYPLIIGYAIIKHHLMDIRVAITRTVILFFVYLLIVGIPLLFALFGKSYLRLLLQDKWVYPPLLLYSVLALLAPYIYLQLQNRAEERRMHQQRQLHQSLKAASKTTIEVQSMDKLSKIIPRYLIRLYGRLNNTISHISLFLLDKNKKIYTLKSSAGTQKLPEGAVITENDYIVKWFTKIRDVLVDKGVLRAKDVEVLVYEEIDFWMTRPLVLKTPFKGLDKVLKQLKKTMESLMASVILPSVYQNELLGFLVLGEKTPDAYSHSDIDTFSILANDSAMAFKAAQLFEDLKIAHARLIQSEKLNLLGQLASSMAHEINNPLAIISGNVQLLLMDENSEERKKILKKINDQTERGYKIINRLLNFSRLPKEDIKDVDVNNLVDDTLELVNHKILHGNIYLERNYNAIPIIKGNSTQIQEVLLNLFVNAIQAMPQGGRLKIFTKSLDSMVQIEVTDTGSGIAEEDAQNIFDPFFSKGKEEGTGLGLFVADQVMKLHQGSIEVKSKIGQGTTFILKFPLLK